MYPDKYPSEPQDYYKEVDGDIVLPDFQPEDSAQEKIYEDIEQEVHDAVRRQVGQMAVGTVGKPEGMTDAEYFQLLRDERESDRAGTHPGTSRELTAEEVKAARAAAKEREKEIKKQKKIDKAINIVQRINPATRDSSLSRELRQAREFLLKNGINPDDHVPDYWK